MDIVNIYISYGMVLIKDMVIRSTSIKKYEDAIILAEIEVRELKDDLREFKEA